jgi:hypothetical protein
MKRVAQQRVVGHGLPVKRKKEKQWTENLDRLIAKCKDIGNDTARFDAWCTDVATTFRDWLVDSEDAIEEFRARTLSTDVASAVAAGVQYLERKRHTDGGRLK